MSEAHWPDGVRLPISISIMWEVGYNTQGVWRSANTLSLLQELGFLYHIDDFSRDEPFIVPVDGKPFVVMPYTRYLNDLVHYAATRRSRRPQADPQRGVCRAL